MRKKLMIKSLLMALLGSVASDLHTDRGNTLYLCEWRLEYHSGSGDQYRESDRVVAATNQRRLLVVAWLRDMSFL